jgi:hypothetical protein
MSISIGTHTLSHIDWQVRERIRAAFSVSHTDISGGKGELGEEARMR